MESPIPEIVTRNLDDPGLIHYSRFVHIILYGDAFALACFNTRVTAINCG